MNRDEYAPKNSHANLLTTNRPYEPQPVLSVSSDGSLGSTSIPNVKRLQLTGEPQIEPTTDVMTTRFGLHDEYAPYDPGPGLEVGIGRRRCSECQDETDVAFESKPDGQPVLGPKCPRCRFRTAQQGLGIVAYGQPTSNRPALLDEASRLRGLGLHEAARRLEADAEAIVDPEVSDAFPVGNCFVTRKANEKFPKHLASLLARHKAGDFGEHGKASEAIDNEASRFLPGLFGHPTKNVAAVRSGNGIASSRYHIVQEFDPKEPHRQLRVIGEVGIVTLYTPSSPPRTVIGVASQGEMVF